MNRASDVARLMCVGFDGLAVNEDLRSVINLGVRSVILFSRNYESREQLTELCREIKALVPATADPSEAMLICVDHEGGRVQRFVDGFTRIPPMRELGVLAARGDKALVEATRRAKDFAYIMALELRSCGIDLNLAPVLDVDSNPDNPVIGERSFSSDPRIVAQLGGAFIDGFQSPANPHRIAACGKHFPGHGDTSIDSHVDLPRLPHDLDRLRRVELVPFASAVEAGIACIMTSHIMFDAIDSIVPATMSERVINGLLRNNLGFRGVVISDDLEMNAIAVHFGVEHGAVRAVAAGADLIMCCHQHERQVAIVEAMTHAVEVGELTQSTIEQAKARLAWLHREFVR